MPRTRHTRPAIAVLIAVVLVAMLGLGQVACSSCTSPPPEPKPEPTATPEPTVTPEPEPQDKTAVRVYLTRGEHLGVGTREVPKTTAVARAALEQLLSGPTAEEAEAGLGTVIPQGTRLLGVSVANGVATVDLSREFESGGGSLSMLMRVSQVVFTLTQFDTVDRVAFMIDGAPVESIGGEGIMVSPSVGRDDFAAHTAPAILVESPTPWQTVKSPMRVTGLSNTFEGTFLYNVVDPRGLIVAEGYTTSTGGMGTWGAFDFTVTYDISYEGVGALIVFEQSAEDGSQIHLVEIPLRMTE
jgi:germination protein M